MDLNEIKNRAKDLLADLTESRPERDGQRDPNRVDDPAARTDRLSGTTGESVAERTDTRPGGPSPAVDPAPPADFRYGADDWSGSDTAQRPARDLDEKGDTRPAVEHRDESVVPPAADFRDERTVPPAADFRGPTVQPAADFRDESVVQPAADFRDERVDRPAAVGMPEHRVLAETREPVQPGAAHPVVVTDPVATDRGPVDDGRHHLREQEHPSSPGADGTVAAAAASAGVSRTEASSGDRERLVTVERAHSYGSRWDDVKGDFVDEPRQAVAKADALVGELLDELGQLFAQQRRGIERDLDNNDASTEDLRVALRRYRSFFDRLLSV
jgi:hypothetical protein